MAIVDFILNLAGLLLWIKWRSLPFDPFNKRIPATLVGTLRRAAPSRFRRWHLLAGIALLLVLRALILLADRFRDALDGKFEPWCHHALFPQRLV